jgi:hypothetical protein
MAVTNLIILSGAVPGIRDLKWRPDPAAALGYLPHRAPNRYGPWTALSATPVPGERFRDQTTLTPVVRTVLPTDWTDQGTLGYWAFRVPAPIYGAVVAGRAILASLPEHVTLLVDGNPVTAARVDGTDGTIWLPQCIMIQGTSPTPTPYVNLTPDSVVVVVYQTLTNFVEPAPTQRDFYTIVPVAADGSLVHPPGQQGDVINILEVDRMDWIQAEEVRRNAWQFTLSGEPAHLMIRMTKGTPCDCLTGGQARTGCTSCYETGFVGGYYGAIDLPFIDPDVGTTTETTEGGRKVTRSSRSYLGPTPWIQAGDLIIRKNGERNVIANPTYKMPRGVLLQQEFDVALLPPGDTRYRIPLRPPLPPIPYDPAYQPKPGPAGEPVVSPADNPNVPWQNTQVVPEGRTVVFGNMNR